jgi:diguanylate cyclase (GGDEF)-like protein
LDISIIPLLDESGVTTHFAAIERDVTEQKISNDRLETLSKIDGLTGLLNHRAFHAEGALEMQRSRRTPKETRGFSIIELDIDHFKRINDTYGHDVGDSVLKQIGTLISDAVRKIDRAGRVGGEEFCLILRNTGLYSAQEIAERLRKTIAEHYFESGAIKLQLTASLGVAEQSNEQEDYTTTLKNADRALYNAKY